MTCVYEKYDRFGGGGGGGVDGCINMRPAVYYIYIYIYIFIYSVPFFSVCFLMMYVYVCVSSAKLVILTCMVRSLSSSPVPFL